MKDYYNIIASQRRTIPLTTETLPQFPSSFHLYNQHLSLHIITHFNYNKKKTIPPYNTIPHPTNIFLSQHNYTLHYDNNIPLF